MQSHLIYVPAQQLKAPTAYGLTGFSIVSVKTQDGLTLKAWYHPAKPHKPTLFFLHGNAGHIGDRAHIVQPYIKEGFGIFLFEYRGYGDNPGYPSETNNVADAEIALQNLRRHNACVIVYGESLGTGVAVALAAQNKVAALILESPFSRLSDVAKKHYPFLPVDIILREQYDSIDSIANIHAPVLLMHGAQDQLVPVTESEKLYQAALPPKSLMIAPDKAHSNLDPMWMKNVATDFLRKNKVCAYS
jgi:fermentation-respiration switch protein FrsA (DUF1100 family)